MMAAAENNHGDSPSTARTASTVRSALDKRVDAGTPPEERLAAAFAHHVARWAQEQGASPDARQFVQRAARSVSQATSDGHSCLTLDQLAEPLEVEGSTPPDRATLRALLIASKVVGTPDAPAELPLIMDDERLYLHRYYDYECRLAASLAARSAIRSDAAADRSGVLTTLPPNVVALLDRLFAGNAPESAALGSAALQPDSPQFAAPDWQKIAAITALLGRLTIISGGPGTGKTTTVVNLLACLLEADPDCRIALTAPTGKAAARMTEVMMQRAHHLPDGLRAKLPTAASTIHRLLGGMPNGEFRHGAGIELPIDVLVVDEASMLDLALAVHLIEAVPANARIILLGDKDQLAAVESGAVFSELSDRPAFSAERIQVLSRFAGVSAQALQTIPLNPPSGPDARAPFQTPADLQPQADLQLQLPLPPPLPLQLPIHLQPKGCLEDSVIWLRRNYRFASGSAIGSLATKIKDGNAAAVLERLENRSDPSLIWLDERGSVPSQACLHAVLDGYASYINALRDHCNDPGAVTAAFGRFRILCALRDGPWGFIAVNRELSMQIRRALEHPLDPGFGSEWYPGRPVMVLRNDPVLKLFNGDIGIVLPDPNAALQVWFADDTGGFRAIPPVRLPDHETAYAMTVHKSQGSEFVEVLLMLPAEQNRVLTRELLYTAVTRARERLTLVANANVVAGTIGTATKRVSGLLARLRHRPP